MSKQKKLKYARIILNKNVLDITNVDGKPTHPEKYGQDFLKRN